MNQIEYFGLLDLGELLAAFEMFELGDSTRQLPGLPEVKDDASANTGPILPIPPEIRPTLVKYRYLREMMERLTFCL